MGSGSGDYLFGKFNEVEVGKAKEALSRCVGCGRFVLIGPPRSGKTFFREKYLKNRLGVGVTVDEHTLGITTTTKTEGKEAKGELRLREKVMRILEGLIPLIGRLREKVRVEDEELRRILGDRAPRSVVEGARGMIGDSPHRAYYIPWKCDEVRKCMEEPSACAFGANVGKALKLIKEAFGDRRIRWFRAEYIPPGLVEEVIELIKERGEDGAKEVLEDWVNAYFEAIEALSRVLGLGEELFEWDEVSIGFLSNFVNNSAKYVIGGLTANPLMGAASLALVSVLTYMAFKREGEGYLKEIIGLRRSLEGLLVKGPGGRLDFNELGKLLAYRVAYAMGMSYDEAKKALMDITGLSIDELERRVNEIEEKIEKLEKKFELSRQEAPAGIVTADVGEFAKGRIYPNIKVESGELRIRVEDGYHSIIRAGKFNELVNEVRDGLLKQGFVVIVGPKGIGKSTLAAAVIWELFMNGDIGLVARVDVLNEDNYQRFETFVENYSEELVKYFGRLLILYDPVSTETYEREPSTQQGRGALAKTGGGVRRVRYVKMPSDVEVTITNLINASSELGDLRPPILIVLPSDIYNTLSEEMRNALEMYRLDVSQALSDREFLAELIREYSKTKDKPNGCELNNDVLGKLASELVKFDSGHALIARLIGEGLARSNCDMGKIEELISKAKGKAEAFIILHINGLFKVHEDPDTAKALVEIFALRRPFVDSVRPGVSIGTPGIIKLIGEKREAKLLYSAEGEELRGWLVRRQHDLIEEAIKKLLICIVNRSKECEELGDALEPWKTIGVIESLREVSEKVSNVDSAVEYFANNYGEKLTNTLKLFSNECWKRAALIIGYASAGHVSVPRHEDLRKDVAESLGDALNRCKIDDYLLVGNEIPPLIKILVFNNTRILTEALYDNIIIKTKIKIITHTYALAEAFVDKYNEAVGEVRRVLNIARSRGSIYSSEEFYGLGLASIIARAVESGKPGDADAALHIASFAIQDVVSPIFIMPILSALGPLRGKAPQRYIELLASASDMENLDGDTVGHIFKELNEILGSYGDVVKEHAWSLVNAIRAYAGLLSRYFVHFSSGEIENIVGRVVGLLNELGRFKSSLGVIARAHALAPALIHGIVRRPMEEALRIKVVGKAGEVLEELNDMRKRVQELMGDKEFMGYVESRFVKADEEAVKKVILGASSHLKHALAIYRLNNDELDEAAKLFNEAAEEAREIGDYENDLIARSWVLRVEAIKGSLLVDEFRRLYEEAFNKERFKLTARYLSVASTRLGNYLVSLALTGGDEEVKKIKELLEEHLLVLNADRRVSILTRLTLNALLGLKDRKDQLGSELRDKLSVEPKELIDILKPHMHSELLPALRVAFGVIKPEDEIKLCEGEVFINVCTDFVLAAKGNSATVEQLRERVINAFNNSLKGLSFDVESLINEFRGLVNGLDGKSLVQLIAPTTSMAWLALMLHALINGDEKLAKALALMGAVYTTVKLSTRLFLEAYDACCDLKSEGFRRAIAGLFFLHV